MRSLVIGGLSTLAILLSIGTAARSNDDRELAPTAAVFIPSVTALNYVEQPVVRDDLGLTRRQKEQIGELRGILEAVDAAARAENTQFDVARSIARSHEATILLGQILSPEQVRRHDQIVMQHLLVRFGLVQLLQAIDAAAILEFDADQVQRMQEILQSVGFGLPARALPGRLPGQGQRRGGPPGQPIPNQGLRGARPNARSGPPQILDVFKNPDLVVVESGPPAEPFEWANHQLSAMLTLSQKKRLIDSLGAPLAVQPQGSPPVVVLERPKVFAFPRVGMHDGWSRSPRIGQSVLIRSPVIPGLLANKAVQDELKLAPDVLERLPPFSGDPQELPQFAEELRRQLQPAQLERLRQLALRTVEQNCGRAALLEYQEAAEALSLTDEQRTALADLLRSDVRSTRCAALSAVERNPEKRSELDQWGNKRLDEILTGDQRQRLAELLGKPFAGVLSSATLARRLEPRSSLRARVAPAPGYIATLPQNHLRHYLISQALHLSPEQVEAVQQSFAVDPQGGKPAVALTLPQRRRYAEIVLQGCVKSEGPAAIYRYRQVIDELSPSPDQKRQLLEVLWNDTRRYLEIPRQDLAEKLPDLDRLTAASIDSILSDEQREKLARLLGEPADKTEAGTPKPGTPAAPSGQLKEHAGQYHRLVHPVRHGSARNLAQVVRQRFADEADVLAAAEPAGNFLLIAAAESRFDEVRAALLQLDRPRKIVIVDVLLVESPLSAVADWGADGDEHWLDERELVGTIDEVTHRLEGLVQQKKLGGLRRFRLETVEDRKATAGAGRQVVVISAAEDTLPAGFAHPVHRARNVEIIIHITPRVTEVDRVSLEIAVRHERLRAPRNADELGLRPEGPLIVPELVSEVFATTATVPSGRATLVKHNKGDEGSKPPEWRIIVAARLAEDALP
jgi:hypothetical protein